MIPPLPQFGQGRPLVSSLDQFKKPSALNRYLWAAATIKANKWPRVIDAACGCGYGSTVLLDDGDAKFVVGFDVDPVSIEVAQRYWDRGIETRFILNDIRNGDPGIDSDVVVSIETIEHVAEPRELLTKFREWVPALVATVPNEDVIPFDPEQYRFHHRHYTPAEFEVLLREFYKYVILEDGADSKELRAVAWDG